MRKKKMRSKVNLMKVESGGTGVPPVRFGVPPKRPRVFFTHDVCGERRAGRPPRQAGTPVPPPPQPIAPSYSRISRKEESIKNSSSSQSVVAVVANRMEHEGARDNCILHVVLVGIHPIYDAKKLAYFK